MDIKTLTDSYAVSPQITPEDIPALAEAGFRRIICNRPDHEIPEGLQAARVEEAARAAGLDFTYIPIVHGAFGMNEVEAQRDAIATADGPVFAYCASGNRSTILWSLALAGQVPTDEMMAAAASNGYSLDQWRGQIDALAKG